MNVISNFIPALWLAFFFAGFSAITESAEQKAVEVPYITQLLAVSNGRVVVVTVEKSGLYLAIPKRKNLQRLSHTPETYIYQATQDPNGILYLATDAGIYRADEPDGVWELVSQESTAWLEFSADGAQSRIKRWGAGLFATPSAHLSVEKAQEVQAMIAQRQALKEQARQRHREFQKADEKKMVMEKFSQWQKLEEQVKNFHVEDGWRKVNIGLPQAPVQTLAILANGEEFAGLFGWGVYRSYNAGADWDSASDGLVSPWVLTLAASPQGDLYAGTFGAGLFRWQADENVWIAVDEIFQKTVIQDLAFGANEQILVGSRERGLFLSLDDGKTWRNLDETALPGNHIQGVAVGSDGAFWVSVWGLGLSVSTDQGISWQLLSFPQATQVKDSLRGPIFTGLKTNRTCRKNIIWSNEW